MTNYSHIFEKEAMVYENYREIIFLLLQQNKTTGPDHSEAMLHYTKMNNQRMNRVEKTTVLSVELLEAIKKIKGKYHFLVISEGWCGDAAQILPVIDKIVKESAGRFKMKIIFRDEHLEIMDQYLTKGGRAIPVLLVLDESNNVILPKWGPRPAVLQNLLSEWKKEEVDYAIVAEKIHSWYAKDKTLNTQAELTSYLSQLT
jgi:thioredoxin-like negative regulator of GroEL